MDLRIDLDFINTVLIHQTRRQKVIEGGISAQLNELFWFAGQVEEEQKFKLLSTKTMEALAEYRVLTAKSKIAYLREHFDTISLMEKRALLTEIHRALEQGEELILDG